MGDRGKRAATLRPLLMLSVLAMASAAGASGCRVSTEDVRRWESTERGPYKLVAVVTHDKYDQGLRVEAALSLVRMPTRGGVRKGLKFLLEKYTDESGVEHDGALPSLSDEQRRAIVNAMAPLLIKEMAPAPPERSPEGRLGVDPTIPFKDAAFGLLVHEPPLVSDEKTKQELIDALVHWVKVGFEDRIENGSQQYGLEQMMRFLGAGSVASLPSLINDKTNRIDRLCRLIADLGDKATKDKASEALVALAKHVATPQWAAEQTKIVKEYNAKQNAKANDEQVAKQVEKMLDNRISQDLFPSMKRIGGRPVVEYLFAYAADDKQSEDRRKLALAALEGHVDTNNARDLERAFAFAKNEDIPDSIRQVAFLRLGEFPKAQIGPKLYTLFTPKKWKTRWVAAETVLHTLSTKQVPDFMSHLPQTPATPMGMTEPLSYGAAIKKMEPAAGQPKPLDAVRPFLASKALGPKLTALGFFWEGAKADVPMVKPYADDKSPLPKCSDEDQCDWQCDVAKPGGKETEAKKLATVGEFVTYCLIPSMEK